MKRVGFVVGLTLLGLGTAHADFQAGLNAYNNKDFPNAVSLWQVEAKAGDHNAQYNLGLLYEKGVEGYPKNLAKAYGWYRLAASQNVPEAQNAVDRIKPIMTAGQIDTGNGYALEVFGEWHRKNIGRNEAEYQAAKANLEKQRKAKIETERQAAMARAERQRSLINQRDADAKLAIALERDSKQAALKAAQEKAEEAKRLAFIEKRRKEEDARMAALRAEQQKQKKLDAARSRLDELKAKQASRTVNSMPAAAASPAASVAAAPLNDAEKLTAGKAVPEPVAQAEKPVIVSSSSAVVAPVKTEPVSAAKGAVAPASKPVVKKKVVVAEPKSVAPTQSKAEVKTQEKAVVATAAPAAPAVKPVTKDAAPVVASPKIVAPKASTAPISNKKPYKAAVAPSSATVVAAKPIDAGKVKLPVMTNGLDVDVVKEIVAKANSTPLNTSVAKQEISKGRTNIEALKWSLISAARGKGSAKRMTVLLEKGMTSAQVAEANRLAADWINQRQSRQ